MCVLHVPQCWPFPSLLSVSFGLSREYPWGLSALSVKQGYKAAFKCRFVHFSCCIFFSEVLLRCRLRAAPGGIVPCILFCIAGCPQPGWVGHGQNTGMCCQRELSFQEQHGPEWCPELYRSRIYLSRILIISFFFSTWHHGWWQKVARNIWKKGLRCYNSPLLGPCAVDIEELAPVCQICTAASLPWSCSRTLMKHDMIERIRCVQIAELHKDLNIIC